MFGFSFGIIHKLNLYAVRGISISLLTCEPELYKPETKKTKKEHWAMNVHVFELFHRGRI